MRVKDFWKIVPLPAKTKLVWDRLTLTNITTVYFVFSVLHCVVQVGFQVPAFQHNVRTAASLSSVTKQGNAVNSKSFYIFQNNLQLCDFAEPHSVTPSCQVLWDRTVGNKTSVPSSPSEAPATNTTTGTSTGTNSCYSTLPTSIEDPQNWDQGPCNNSVAVKRMTPDTIETVKSNTTVQVVLSGTRQNKESAILDEECLLVLGWPVQSLKTTQREDFVFIMFQIWVLGMSIVAILNESIPHMIATLLTHLVATGWTGFQMFATIQFRSDLSSVMTNGACRSVDPLAAYWQPRANDELFCLVSNCIALLVSAFLCWKLAKSFGWQTFKRIGASRVISRTYKIVLTLSIIIQLSSFFILTSIALWLDQLLNGAIGHLATWPFYRHLLIVTLIFLPLWLAFGWYSVRREHKAMTFAFLAMCCGYLAGWGAMFDSITFRCTYKTWPFFAVMTTTSVLLTLLAFILGIVCRINFGKGLPYYLEGHEPIEEGFEAVDPEKLAFSWNRGSTYAIPFGSRIQFPPVSHVSAPNAAQPMQTNSRGPQQPPRAVTRAPSERACHSVHQEPSGTLVSSSNTWI